jgi:hypothetical protein
MSDLDRPEPASTLEENVDLFRRFVAEYLPAGAIEDHYFAMRLMDVEAMLFNVKLSFDHYRQRSCCVGGPAPASSSTLSSAKGSTADLLKDIGL